MSKEFVTPCTDISWLTSATAQISNTFLQPNPWIFSKPKTVENPSCNCKSWEPTLKLAHVCKNLCSYWPALKSNNSKDIDFSVDKQSFKGKSTYESENLSYFDSNMSFGLPKKDSSYLDLFENHASTNNLWLQPIEGEKRMATSNPISNVFKRGPITTAEILDYQKSSLINNLFSSNDDILSNDMLNHLNPVISNNMSGKTLPGTEIENTRLSLPSSDTYSPPSFSGNSPSPNTDLIAMMQELALVSKEEASLRLWLSRQNLGTPFQSPPSTPFQSPTLTPPSTPTKGCVFCKNNNYHCTFYKSHVLKDERGHCQCPVLRTYICPLCGGTEDSAHTLKYCPHNTVTKGDPIAAGLPPGKVTNWREVASKMSSYYKI